MTASERAEQLAEEKEGQCGGREHLQEEEGEEERLLVWWASFFSSSFKFFSSTVFT